MGDIRKVQQSTKGVLFVNISKNQTITKGIKKGDLVDIDVTKVADAEKVQKYEKEKAKNITKKQLAKDIQDDQTQTNPNKTYIS